MNVFVKKYKIAYLSYMYYKQTSGERQSEIHFIETMTLLFHVDYCMLITLGRLKENNNLYVIINIFIKFMVMKPVKDTNEP